tara:strand:- start:112 stop:711 length:600 start_codon:yes stop_codon:yes gene_type:complete
MSYTLLLRGPSPFGRKCTFAINYLGLADKVEISEPDSEDHIQRLNPLAKIPALILEQNKVLFDSRVILEYLDSLAGGGKIIPSTEEERFCALQQAAMADGILEAALLITYEKRYRPDQLPYEPWLDFQREKIIRALKYSAGDLPPVDTIHVGSIGLACVLEYLDFRQQYNWRPNFTVLVQWIERFNKFHPSFKESKPYG